MLTCDMNKRAIEITTSTICGLHDEWSCRPNSPLANRINHNPLLLSLTITITYMLGQLCVTNRLSFYTHTGIIHIITSSIGNCSFLLLSNKAALLSYYIDKALSLAVPFPLTIRVTSRSIFWLLPPTTALARYSSCQNTTVVLVSRVWKSPMERWVDSIM